jgi:GNAT superfamily N-acetyltransferase
MTSIKTAGGSDMAPLLATIVEAFADDPAARWLYPDDAQYRALFPDFACAFGGRAVETATAHYTEDYAGAALWLPPGTEPDEETMMGMIEATAREEKETIAAVLEAMGSYHPSEPHWYLPLIGVAPASQGRGYGSALLKHALSACDEAGLAAYLESSNPRNLPLYERHGFALLGTIQIGASPPIYPMLRPAGA